MINPFVNQASPVTSQKLEIVSKFEDPLIIMDENSLESMNPVTPKNPKAEQKESFDTEKVSNFKKMYLFNPIFLFNSYYLLVRKE